MDHLKKISAIRPKKIAVVGSGISGLSCAWLLNKAHQVTLFEKDDRLGGHSNTVSFELGGQQVDVDTGFIVFNPLNYPNLVRFFEALDVDSCDTDMSFAVSINRGQLEYSGTGLSGLFAQKRNLVSPSFWGMVNEIFRFFRESGQIMERENLDTISLGDLLAELGFSKAFIYDHLLPMGAAIWSTPVEKMLDYPAASFMRFCHNHGLVRLKERPQWRTVVGGSKQYVGKIAGELKGKIHLNSRAHKILRHGDQVIIEDYHGKRGVYDEVVLACHSDQALDLLENPSEDEAQLLKLFPYQRNKAYLHLDNGLMPKRRAAWSSWNYLSEGKRGLSQEVSVTYWMNKLQPLPTDQNVFVSLNPLREPKGETIVRSFFYDHPEFGRNALQAQQQLWRLQGKQHTWFCGAYFGYGFHEDGLQAGLAVAEQLGGIPRPWALEDKNSRIHVGEPSEVSIVSHSREQAYG